MLMLILLKKRKWNRDKNKIIEGKIAIYKIVCNELLKDKALDILCQKGIIDSNG